MAVGNDGLVGSGVGIEEKCAGSGEGAVDAEGGECGIDEGGDGGVGDAGRKGVGAPILFEVDGESGSVRSGGEA